MKLYSTKEAAEYLGLSERTVKHHLYTTGKLSGQLIGNSMVFTQEELDKFSAIPRLAGRPKIERSDSE